MTPREPRDHATSPSGKASIAERQNNPANLRVLKAARQRHEDAKRLHAARTLGTLLLAALSPLVAFLLPRSAIYLGAVGGAWVLLARAFLLGAEQRGIRDGALLQEQFDCGDLVLSNRRGQGCLPPGRQHDDGHQVRSRNRP